MTGATAYKAALLEAAARYVAHGWQLFVCGNDKRPLQQGGFKNASTDLSRLDRVLTRHADGIAVRTGWRAASSSLMSTSTPPKGLMDEDGEAQQKGLPDCPTTETPRGGTHLYFAHPGGSLQCSAGQLAKGVDVRGDGGSLHHGRQREHIAGGQAQLPKRHRRCPNGYWRAPRHENRYRERPLRATNGGGPFRN